LKVRNRHASKLSRGIESHLIGDASDIITEDSGTIMVNIAQAYDLARGL